MKAAWVDVTLMAILPVDTKNQRLIEQVSTSILQSIEYRSKIGISYVSNVYDSEQSDDEGEE